MVNNAIEKHIEIIRKVQELYISDIEKIGEVIKDALRKDKTIYFMGNGGSAADSQHLAAELVGRFKKERMGFPAVALTTDTSILTAIGNDYGYDKIFERQVQALVREGDVVFGITTSGNSENVVKAIELAKKKGAFTVGLLGRDGGILKNKCDISITVPHEESDRIQEAHIMIGHILCEIAEGE